MWQWIRFVVELVGWLFIAGSIGMQLAHEAGPIIRTWYLALPARPMRSRRWGPFRQQWYSICSSHYEHCDGCSRCETGRWVNVYANVASSLFFRACPTLWRIWANRPWSPQRKFLEETFPKLRGH